MPNYISYLKLTVIQNHTLHKGINLLFIRLIK